MKRLLCSALPRAGHSTPLGEDEANHAVRVLRLRDGDLVEAIDGKGHAVTARLRVRGGGGPRLELDESQGAVRTAESPDARVVLEMAVLKGDAMEWVVEKAVELGVQSLIPVITERTVVQMDRKGPEAFRERWQKIADQALKQSGRLERMEVRTPLELAPLMAQESSSVIRLWCDEVREGLPDLTGWLLGTKKIDGEFRLLIGPEGGWSDAEREMLSRSLGEGMARVDLGPHVLRAETAAISAASVALALLRSRAKSRT